MLISTPKRRTVKTNLPPNRKRRLNSYTLKFSLENDELLYNHDDIISFYKIRKDVYVIRTFLELGDLFKFINKLNK